MTTDCTKTHCHKKQNKKNWTRLTKQHLNDSTQWCKRCWTAQPEHLKKSLCSAAQAAADCLTDQYKHPVKKNLCSTARVAADHTSLGTNWARTSYEARGLLTRWKLGRDLCLWGMHKQVCCKSQQQGGYPCWASLTLGEQHWCCGHGGHGVPSGSRIIGDLIY